MKKVLVINPFGIGDALFSMTLVEALKKAVPGLNVGFMGNERTVELLRMDPSIDVCHEFNRDEFRGQRKKGWGAYFSRARAYVREMKRERYDAVFDLSLGREFSFAAFLAGIPRRVGFNYKNRGFFLTDKINFSGYEGKHVVDWQLSLLGAAGLEARPVSALIPLNIPPSAEDRAIRLLQMLAGQGFFAVAPGGGRTWGSNAVYKQWSPERFAAAADAQSASSRTGVVLLGDAGEAALLEQVARKMRTRPLLIAGEGLGVVSALLKRSRFLLCNDGGLLHLANALGVKTVSIYGPVDEKVYGPYDDRTTHAVLTAAVPCRPCYKDFHFPPCPHSRRCQEELSEEKVLAELAKIS